ncbi:MAG: hypothetical protein AAF974_09000 [Cyanobacteria bacterium P01_E01_bin.34]
MGVLKLASRSRSANLCDRDRLENHRRSRPKSVKNLLAPLQPRYLQNHVTIRFGGASIDTMQGL